MKNLEYKFNNFKLLIKEEYGKYILTVFCTLSLDDVTKTFERTYDLTHTITKVIFDEEYVYLNYNISGLVGYDNDSQYCLKFEHDSGLVIDTFDDGNHQNVIGCHDFWDEY